MDIERLIEEEIEGFKTDCKGQLDCEKCAKKICVKAVAMADLPSEFGQFKIIGFVNNKDAKEHIVILKGDIGEGESVLLRIHSSCLTGDALGSRRCDCGPQLHFAMQLIEKEGRGIVLYHQAEGRGIGLINKIKAYVLQDKGMDTVDANIALGFKADERSYEIPAEMLKKIGVKSVRLLTNNPEKIDQIEEYGIKVVERLAIELPHNPENEDYLKTKKNRFGHFLHL